MPDPSKPTHQDIYGLLEELRSQVGYLVERVGHEADDGKTGTGLTGRIMRTESRVLAYDRLKDRVIAAVSTSVVFIGIIWWLIRVRVAGFFNATP